MNGFLYGAALQWKLDIRSKSLLVTCYIVPLIFFLLMGGIFTSVMPEMRSTLIQSMLVMSVSMGAFIGLPPSLIEKMCIRDRTRTTCGRNCCFLPASKKRTRGGALFCVKVLDRLFQKAAESKGGAVGRPPQRAKTLTGRKIRRGE